MKTTRYLLLFVILFTAVNLSAQDRELVNVVVGNEGNFGSGNATLTNYVLENETATDGVFLDANGSALGDVVQSLAWIDGEIYVVVNNSQKIVILDPESFQQTGQIMLGEGASPREIVKVSESKAYMTDLYAGAVLSVNLDSGSVTEDTIQAGLNPDRIIEHDGFAYVANNGFGSDSTIFKINVETDAVVDTFEVSRGPAGMTVDSGNTLWVVCTGYPGDFDEDFNLIPGTSRPGGLHGIDLETGEEQIFAGFASAGSDIALDEEDKVIYINSGGVLAFDLDLTQQSSPDTLIPGSFYAMGYETESNSFYLADAKDFSSAGQVTIHNTSGMQVGSFDTGIAPGSFLFVYDDMINTAAETEESVRSFTLSQNYPNPFNPSTVISYQLAVNSEVHLEVFKITGQKVATLVDGKRAAGEHRVTFDASKLASGVYVYRIFTEQGSLSRKMILVK